MYGIFNLVLFAALLGFLFQLSKMEMGLSRRVLVGLVLGSIFGFYLQLVFGLSAGATGETLEWTNVVANSYVNLLRMIIIPLVLITMMASVLRVEEIRSLGKIGGTVIGILVLTTMIAASIGIVMANLFGLNAGELASGARELARAEVLESRLATDRSISQLLTGMVPRNIFADMSEARSTSIIAVAIFGMLIGVAALFVSEEDENHGSRIKSFVDTTQAVIMRLVKLVISLTPLWCDGANDAGNRDDRRWCDYDANKLCDSLLHRNRAHVPRAWPVDYLYRRQCSRIFSESLAGADFCVCNPKLGSHYSHDHSHPD
jgi:L-cystine uptake protein TcyP (sodium:dicarboxylate symporter family)